MNKCECCNKTKDTFIQDNTILCEKCLPFYTYLNGIGSEELRKYLAGRMSFINTEECRTALRNVFK
jgi:hypothetical protein